MSLYDMPQSAFDALNEDYLAESLAAKCDECGKVTDNYALIEQAGEWVTVCSFRCWLDRGLPHCETTFSQSLA